MVKKKQVWGSILMIVYWAFYLTITMSLFERAGIVPHNVPGDVFGWMFFVEVPRVLLGFLISLIFFKYKGGKK